MNTWLAACSLQFGLALIMLFMAGCGGSPMKDPEAGGNLEFDGRLTEFSGRYIKLMISASQDKQYTIDSANNLVEEVPYTPLVPGHVGRGYVMQKKEISPDQTQLGYAALSWDDDDPSDYLAGGVWMLWNGYPEILNLREISGLVLFMDGPEIDTEVPPTLPVTGTASYEGASGGIFQYRYSAQHPEHPGGYAIAEYGGSASFTADFAEMTVSGCIGCNGGLVLLQDQPLQHLLDGLANAPATVAGYTLHLGPVPFNEAGIFENDRISVRHPSKNVLTTEGYFGGQFSNLPNSNGDPRLMTGIYDGTLSEADGARARFLGIATAIAQ
ncbi:MAG: hypothetical protein OXC42_01210 [Gammaproteobacteria bacterium]|nr:hypothetical protein [Gammaproteobacteria bacterium]